MLCSSHLHTRLAGYHPFDVYGDLPEAQLIEKMNKVEYEFDEDVWGHTSEEVRACDRLIRVS